MILEFTFLQIVAASCVWLASKLEENPKKARQVIIVFHRMECRRENLPIDHLDLYSKVSMPTAPLHVSKYVTNCIFFHIECCSISICVVQAKSWGIAISFIHFYSVLFVHHLCISHLIPTCWYSAEVLWVESWFKQNWETYTERDGFCLSRWTSSQVHIKLPCHTWNTSRTEARSLELG